MNIIQCKSSNFTAQHIANMALRIFVRRRVRRCTLNAKAPKLNTLAESRSLILLTHLQGTEAVNLLNRLQMRFSEADSLTLINLNNVDKLTALRDGHRSLVETGKKNLTFFGSLSKPLAELLRGINAQILINTDNSSSDLLHLIAATLPADLKCGMYNPFELPLYNPLITPAAEQEAEDYISTVEEYLKSLSGKK